MKIKKELTDHIHDKYITKDQQQIWSINIRFLMAQNRFLQENYKIT